MSRVLVVNAGSSSLKLRLLGGDDTVEQAADVEAGPDGVAGDDLTALLDGWAPPDAVGHRVVHGGTRFTRPTVIDAQVRHALEELGSLAPLHQPKSLAGLDAVSRLLPDVPAVGMSVARRQSRVAGRQSARLNSHADASVGQHDASAGPIGKARPWLGGA